MARSSLCLAPAHDRLVQSWDVVAQGDPDLFIVDPVVGVRGDDPHALDLAPGNLRCRLDDLVRQLGGNVPQPADDSLSRETQYALGVPALFPSRTSSAAASAASARSARRSSTPLSQIHGLGANVIVPGLEGTPCDDVHTDAQEILQILEQADVIKQGRAGLEIYKQIYIAV